MCQKNVRRPPKFQNECDDGVNAYGGPYLWANARCQAREDSKANGDDSLDWYSTVFELIDMRSFSNLWFWIVLAVAWSSASHWVLGVPSDMVARARRKGGKAADDLTDLLRINTSRLLFIAEEAGLWIIAAGAFFLTGFAVLGWVYDIEIAQALFLLAFPMSIISLMSVRTARALHEKDHDLEAVYRRLGRHRLMVQAIGMVSIFITAMWGMYVNLSIGVLGG